MAFSFPAVLRKETATKPPGPRPRLNTTKIWGVMIDSVLVTSPALGKTQTLEEKIGDHAKNLTTKKTDGTLN